MRHLIKSSLLIALLLVSMGLAACARGTEGTTEVPTNTPESTPTPEGSSSLTPEALENAVYQSEWPEDGIAQLTDGEYRKPIVEGSATELIIQLTDMAFGDLDGDGIEDAAVILVTDPGGSGTFYDLAAVLNRNGKPEHVATASLGDRAEIRAFSIEAGQVIIEMVIHGPDDPMCCPTQIVRNTYALEGDALVEMASEVIGSAEGTSKAEIPVELLGVVWQWQEYVDMAGTGDITVDDRAKYTLEFLPDGNYRIVADCNRSSGRYLADGSALILEPGPTTLAECEPGSLYDEYLPQLGDVVIYVLDEGRLVLSLEADAGNMIFVPAEDAAFVAWLKETLAARDYDQLRALMGETFAIAGWRSEGQFYPPDDAIVQLRNIYLGPDTTLVFPERDLHGLLGGIDPLSIVGPDVGVVQAVYVEGWGFEGHDEALLYIAQRPDGTHYWYGVLFAEGGFGQPTSPDEPLETDVEYVLALQDVMMYSGPADTYDVIGGVFDGQIALVTGVSADGGWWRVICPDETVGSCWVSADPQLTQPTTPPTTGDPGGGS